MGAGVKFAREIVRDEPGAMRAALAELLAECDGVVVTGGSSVGERDLTPGAVAELGEPGVIVHGLRVRPGKPTVLGAVGQKPVIGLPGNPTSALTDPADRGRADPRGLTGALVMGTADRRRNPGCAGSRAGRAGPGTCRWRSRMMGALLWRIP